MIIPYKEFEELQEKVATLSERIVKLEVNSEFHKELIDEFKERVKKLE